MHNLIANTLLDEDTTSVLVDYRLLVLCMVSNKAIYVVQEENVP
jgi:hypothetical protein